MNKQQQLLLLAAVVVIVIAIAAAAFLLREKTAAAEGEAVVELQTSSGKPLLIRAEIADTDEEIKKGLMFRQSLREDESMLFVFPNVSVQSFWMKNTLIPLDMVFISEKMTIAKIRHAVPCTSEPCPPYNSEKAVKYVLEFSGNATTSYGIKEGSSAKVSLPTQLLK